MEKELRKAFEDVTTGNVKAAIAYCKETRRMLREAEAKVVTLQNRVTAQDAQMDQFRIQLAGVQTKLFSGGTSE